MIQEGITMLMHDNEEFLNISEIADELGLDPESVLTHITTGKLKSREVDKVYYSTISDIKAFLQSNKAHHGHRGRK